MSLHALLGKIDDAVATGSFIPPGEVLRWANELRAALAGGGEAVFGVARHARTHWDIRGDGAGNFEEYVVRFDGHPAFPQGTKIYTHPSDDAPGVAVNALMAARETEDDGAAIMGRLARALAKADPSSHLPGMAIEWLRSQGVTWKSHCPTDPLHAFGDPMTGEGDHDDLPRFLEWIADELVRRDTRPGTLSEGVAQSLMGRAYILRYAAAINPGGSRE